MECFIDLLCLSSEFLPFLFFFFGKDNSNNCDAYPLTSWMEVQTRIWRIKKERKTAMLENANMHNLTSQKFS